MIRNIAVTPIIEMRIVTEGKLVERYLILDIFLLIIDNKIYNMLYNVSTKYQQQINFLFLVNSLFGQGT